jgi:hypothetical protein
MAPLVGSGEVLISRSGVQQAYAIARKSFRSIVFITLTFSRLPGLTY